MLQLEDKLLRKGRGNVRCQGTNGSGLIGRLGRPIKVTFRDKIKSLLRDPLYLKRGDAIKSSKRLEGKPSLLPAVGEALRPAFPALLQP
jgi:hypothetical protein